MKKPAKGASHRPTIPRLLLAQLIREPWTEREESIYEKGLAEAKRRRKHAQDYEMDTFPTYGKCTYKPGDLVIQVTHEGERTVLVSPPANVLHVLAQKDQGGQVSMVYLERPVTKRRRVKAIAQRLGCLQKRLLQEGVVRELAFARSLLNYWASGR